MPVWVPKVRLSHHVPLTEAGRVELQNRLIANFGVRLNYAFNYSMNTLVIHPEALDVLCEQIREKVRAEAQKSRPFKKCTTQDTGEVQ